VRSLSSSGHLSPVSFHSFMLHNNSLTTNRIRNFCRLSNFSFAFGLITLVNLIIFAPSLKHFFYGDDWVCLLPTIGGRAITPTNDPNYLLFSPLCHALLSVETNLFGTCAWPWHLSGIIMHLAVLFVFLKLLRKLTTPAAAFSLVLIFSSITLNSQAVTWANASRHMLFLACVLGLFYYLHDYAQNPNRRVVIKAVLCATIASFLYEQGIIAAALSALYLGATAKTHQLRFRWEREGLIFLPLVIYALFYLPSHVPGLMAFRQYPHPYPAHSNFIVGCIFAPVFMLWWSLGIFFPSFVLWAMPSPIGRLVATIHQPALVPFLFDLFPAIILTTVFLLAINKKSVTAKAPMLLLAGTLAFLYALIIAIGRVSTYGFSYTFNFGAYYAYIFCGYLTVMAACLIDPASLSAKTKTLVWPVLLFFILHNSFYVVKLNYYLLAQSRVLLQYQQHMKAFVAAHRNEPDFSLRIDNDIDIFFISPKIPLAKMLCDYRYLNTLNPKYTIDLHQTEFYKAYLREQKEEPQAWYSF